MALYKGFVNLYKNIEKRKIVSVYLTQSLIIFNSLTKESCRENETTRRVYVRLTRD